MNMQVVNPRVWMILFLMAGTLRAAGPDAGPARTVTEITLTDEVLTEECRPFGINVHDTWYSAAHMTKRRDVRTFEGSTYRSIFWGPAMATNGLYSWFGVPEQMGWEGVYTGASFRVLTGPGRGATGVVAAIEKRRKEIHGEERDLTFIRFDRAVPEPGKGSKHGVMIERHALDEGHLESLSGPYWISPQNRLVSGDVSRESFGSHALLLDASAEPAHLRLTGMRPEFADCTGEWVLRLRTKGVGGSPRLEVTGDLEADVEVRPSWGHQELRLEVDDQPGGENLDVRLMARDGRVLVDDIELIKGGDENPTPFRDAVVDMMQELRPGILRYLQMGGSTIRNTIADPVRQHRFASSPWMKTGPDGRQERNDFSLHEFYELCDYVDAAPWYCVPGVLHLEEIDHLMEYLGAPADVGYGRKRAELGHSEPWTDTLETIYIQFGNEAWNSWGPFMCGGFNGPDYWKGLIDRAKSSPYYSPRIVFVVGGQNFNSGLNRSVAEAAPNADRLALAPYIIQKFPKEVSEALDTQRKLYEWLFAYPVHRMQRGGMDGNAELSRQHNLPLMVYEINHHATAGKGDLEKRNEFLASIAGGLNVLNAMLIGVKDYGMTEQCFFTMFGRLNNAYMDDVRLFGAVLNMKEGEERRRPHWYALTLANRLMKGDLVRSIHSDNEPVFSTPMWDRQSKQWERVEDVPVLHSYAFRDGAQRGLLVLNLDVSEPREIRLNTTGKGEHAVESWLLSAEAPSANNEIEFGPPSVLPQSGGLKSVQSGTTLTVPAHSLLALRWVEAE